MRILIAFLIIVFGISSTAAQTKSEDLRASDASSNASQRHDAVDFGLKQVFEDRVSNYQAAAEHVRTAVNSPDSLKRNLNAAIESLPANSYQAIRLKQILKSDDVAEITREAKPNSMIETKLNRIADELSFKPILEAKSPEGFGPPTMLGEVEIKSYPAYRMAQTEVLDNNTGTRSPSAFFKLFNHIKSNEIAMTSPVKMIFAKSDGGMRETAMAFLYQNQKIGEVDEKDNVKVIDVEPAKFISLGMRGEISQQQIENAFQFLKEILPELSSEYESAGNARVMGYNGPSVSSRDRFHEAQLQLRAKVKSDADFKDASSEP